MPPRPVRDAEVTFPVGAANLPTINSVCQLDTGTGQARLPSAASVAPIGVAQADAVASKEITVLQEGIARCVASAAISIGDFVEIANVSGQIRTKAQTANPLVTLQAALTPAAVNPGVNALVPVQITVAPTGIPATVAPSGNYLTQISVAPTGIPAGNVAANSSQDVALTGITGLLATDQIVEVRKAADQTGLEVLPGPGALGGVTGAGAATIRYVNDTVAGITPTAAEVYTFTILRQGTAATPVALTGITGLLATDVLVAVNKAAAQNGLKILPGEGATGGVTGAGAASVFYVNGTMAPIVPTAGETYTFTVLRTQAGGGSGAEQTLAFAGVLAGDVAIAISKPTVQAGLSIGNVRIPSAGNVAIEFVNDTPAAITPTAGETYTLTVFRQAIGAALNPTPIVGRALTAASAAGDFVDVLLMIGANY